MDFIKYVRELPPKEPGQPVMSDHLVRDDIPRISLRTDVPGHKVYRPIKVNPLDISGSEKWESKHRLDDLYVRWIGEPLGDLLVKIFERLSRNKRT